MIDDANTDEYAVKEKTTFTLHGYTDTPLIKSLDKKTFIKHIEDNIYEIRGYAYESTCSYALLNIDGIKISVCNSCDAQYKRGDTYEGIISLSYDIWDCYHMNVCSHNEDKNLYIEGIVEEIHLITAGGSKYATLAQTNSLKDITPHEPSSYLIGVTLSKHKSSEKESNPLQIDNDTLTLSLKGINDYKVKLIKEYIQKILRLNS